MQARHKAALEELAVRANDLRRSCDGDFHFVVLIVGSTADGSGLSTSLADVSELKEVLRDFSQAEATATARIRTGGLS